MPHTSFMTNSFFTNIPGAATQNQIIECDWWSEIAAALLMSVPMMALLATLAFLALKKRAK